jgi:hypothetical protein
VYTYRAKGHKRKLAPCRECPSIATIVSRPLSKRETVKERRREEEKERERESD